MTTKVGSTFPLAGLLIKRVQDKAMMPHCLVAFLVGCIFPAAAAAAAVLLILEFQILDSLTSIIE